MVGGGRVLVRAGPCAVEDRSQIIAIAQAVSESDRPVLLNRWLMATIQELLLSAEYIVAQGNWQVILCERGTSTFKAELRLGIFWT